MPRFKVSGFEFRVLGSGVQAFGYILRLNPATLVRLLSPLVLGPVGPLYGTCMVSSFGDICTRINLEVQRYSLFPGQDPWNLLC